MTWTAVDRGHGWAVENEHGLTIAWMGQGSVFKASGVHSITMRDCKRHAEMIAAVPDLVSALAAITDQLERVGDTHPEKDGRFIADARAALARTTEGGGNG